MREITVKKFLKLTKGKRYNVESMDGYGVYISMGGVAVTYDKDSGEIGFLKGQGCEVSFNVEDCVGTIMHNENGGYFTIEFSLCMADVILTEIGV